MKILIVTPAPPRSRTGNRMTALRWKGILRQLGHRVTIAEEYRRHRPDVLLALHARKSAASVEAFRRRNPHKPVLLALTGTDLYGDIQTDPAAQRSLQTADALVLLQADGVKELPADDRRKAWVIYQSVETPSRLPEPRGDVFEVCVIGHLRAVKDPLRTAMAARLLPAESSARIIHLGGALDASLQKRALAEMDENPRYRWLGEVPRWQARRWLARSRLLVLTSTMEGGANVVSEALAVGTPVVSSRISGSVGLLGDDYPGYFPVGDTRALAKLLQRAEEDEAFYKELKHRCLQRRPLVDPDRECQRWQELLQAVKRRHGQ